MATEWEKANSVYENHEDPLLRGQMRLQGGLTVQNRHVHRKPFGGRCCRFLGIEYAALRGRVLAGGTDPLEERHKQLEGGLPRLQAELDVCQVRAISAEEVATEAQNLPKLWPTMTGEETRQIVEAITDRIEVGKDQIGRPVAARAAYSSMGSDPDLTLTLWFVAGGRFGNRPGTVGETNG
jgi:hypothetical protein